MRQFTTHLARARDLGRRVTTYTPSTYTITWPDGTTSQLTKSGWNWDFRGPDGWSAQYRHQVDAFDAIANLGGTYKRN
jgi:hypothetical protein